MEAIQYSRCIMVPTTSSLAFQLGYSQRVTGERGAAVELLLGDYDHHGDRLWMRQAGASKAFWSRSRGADTRAICFSWHESTQSIYALPGSGLETAADLKGRRIALIRTEAEFDVDRSVFLKPYFYGLASANLTLADVRIVDTPIVRTQNIFAHVAHLFLTQLIRGEVDAIATPLPAGVVSFFGLKTIYDGRTDPDLAARVDLRAMIVSAAVIREQRGVVVRLLASLLEAADWAREHPADAARLLETDLKLAPGTLAARGTDVVRLAQIDVTAEQIDMMRHRKEFLLATGTIERGFSIDDWVDGSLIAEARELRTLATR
jgi:ABC-type nitrate/sulfonate/bicarbonate transport system substrate-binding protein